MNRFAIIHLSDTQFGPKHVFKSPSDITRRLVDDILSLAEARSFTPVYLLISGDISETANADQFREASTVFAQVADAVSIDRSDVLFVPGNHDVNWALSEIGPTVGDERLKFSCYDKFCERFYGDLRPRAAYRDDTTFPIVVDGRFGLTFLLLNSAEKETHKSHGGHVSEEELLKTLDASDLKDAQKRGFLRIAVLHHRIDVAAKEEKSCIDNAANVESILSANGFQLVLTGHVHAAITHAVASTGSSIVYSGCGSTGVDMSQRQDGIPNQYSIHVLDRSIPQIGTYFRAYNPRRKTQFGLGGWTTDSSHDVDPQVFPITWKPTKDITQNVLIEDARLATAFRIRKNPFTVSNAEKISQSLVLQLFVLDEARHRAANRLSGDAIVRGKRGSGKTMCLRYLDLFGSKSFKNAVRDRKTAECLPVFVNLGQLHPAQIGHDANTAYHAAEDLITEQTLDAIDRAVTDVQSPEFKHAVFRMKQRLSVLKNQSGTSIGKLGAAIKDTLSAFFDHVLLLIDEVAPVFPREFFTQPDHGFVRWMNAIRNSGPFNTRLTVYPNDVSDTLNEDRFGSIINLEYNARDETDYKAFREYATNLIDRYLRSVAIDPKNSPTVTDLVALSDGSADDALEQILYASDGSSRRLMRLADRCLDFRIRGGRDDVPLSKNEVFEVISDYSVALSSAYSKTEQQLAASISKACKKAGTFRFRLPYLSQGVKPLHSSREESNVLSVVEVGSGSRGTTYEFNFPYCIQMGIPTHHVKGTSRIYQGRDRVQAEWIQRATAIKKENLDIFEDADRQSGRVIEVDDGMALIRSSDGKDFIAEEPDSEIKIGDTVSFLSNGGSAYDLVIVS